MVDQKDILGEVSQTTPQKGVYDRLICWPFSSGASSEPCRTQRTECAAGTRLSMTTLPPSDTQRWCCLYQSGPVRRRQEKWQTKCVSYLAEMQRVLYCVYHSWHFHTCPYIPVHSSTFPFHCIILFTSIPIPVGGFGTFFIVHNMWDVILPIDELHHFSRWLEPPTSYGSSEIIIDLYESHINHIILTILIFTILITSYHKLTTIYINHIILIPMVQHASLAPGLCSGAWASPSDGGFFKTCGAMGAQVANYNHQMQWPKVISG